MMAKRFNRLGVREIDLTGWHDEVICHWAWEQKTKDGIEVWGEFRITLYAPNGTSYTKVIETKLEDQ